MITKIFGIILDMSISATVAAILIILIRYIIAGKIPAIFIYSLWSIVLIRLIIPFSVSSHLSIFNVISGSDNTVIQTVSREYISARTGIKQNTTNADPDISTGHMNGSINIQDETIDQKNDPANMIPWIWFAAAMTLFAIYLSAYLYTTYKLRDAVLYDADALLSKCMKRVKMKRKIRVYSSEKVDTPVVCGLLKPCVILPQNLMLEYDDKELEYILTHELVHIKRSDHILKPLSVMVYCLHWFNPVILFALKLLHKDMEKACDEKVMSVFDKDIRGEYASSLINIAKKQNVSAAGGLLAFGENNIKSRIKGIMNFKKFPVWISSLLVLALIIFGVALLTDANSGDDNTPEATEMVFDKNDIEEYILADSVVITDVAGRTGPGEGYSEAYDLKYGDVIVITGKYKGWMLATVNGTDEFWVHEDYLIDDQKFLDYNLGIITADEVTVGAILLKKGNLIQILIEDDERSCVTIRVIDINGGRTGWISNDDYAVASTGVYYNQAYLKKDTIIYTEPSINAKRYDDHNYSGNYELFVNIEDEQDGWVYIFTYGPIFGWVQKEDVFFP